MKSTNTLINPADLMPHPLLARSAMMPDVIAYLRESDPEEAEKQEAWWQSFCEDVATNGLIDPVRVVPGEAGKFLVVAGRHRLLAARLAGMEVIPCLMADAGAVEHLILASDSRRPAPAGLRAWLAVQMHPEVVESKPGKRSSDQSEYTRSGLARQIGVSADTVDQAAKLYTLAKKLKGANRDKIDAAIAAGRGLGALIAGLEGAAALEDDTGTKRKPESNLKGFLRAIPTLKTALKSVGKWNSENRELAVSELRTWLAGNDAARALFLEAINEEGEGA